MNTEVLLKHSNETSRNTLMETLSITFVAIGEDFITAKMPVNERVHQPDGVLHGGATFALAESVGSFASFLFNKRKDHVVRGIEMSGNHIKSVRDGHVYAKAQAIHFGKTTQVWDIKVTDDDDHLISSIKLTTVTLPKK